MDYTPKTNTNPEDSVETFSIKDFMLLCLRYWKWFLLSVIVFIGIALFYIYTRQPVFERSEELLVKDQESGGAVGNVTSSFSDLGLFSSSPKVYNELVAFTSPAVMREVVERLQLTQNFTQRDGLKSETLYGTKQPVIMEFPDLTDKDNVGLRLNLEPDGSFKLEKIYKIIPGGKQKFEEVVSGKIDGPAVNTPLGRVLVKKNIHYIPNPSKDGKEWKIDYFRQSVLLALEKYVAKLKGDLADPDADVINLSIMDTSVERADDILNMIVVVYNERWIEDNNKVSVATSQFITDRLQVIEKELSVIDDNIAALKSKMQLPDLEEAAKGYMQQEFMISGELLKASNMLAMSQFLKEYMENPKNRYSIIPMNTGTENMVLEQQIGVYNEVLLSRNKLMENSSVDNPLVRDYDLQLEGLRTSILNSINSHISNLTAAIKNTEEAQSGNKESLSSSPMQARELLQLERQQEVMQELYLYLLQKREENELTKSFFVDNTRIITPPYGPLKPVSPKKKLIIIIAFFLGLGIPGVALFLAESSNTKIRSKKDLENLQVPFAGEIPQIGKKKKLLNIFRTKKRKQKAIDKPRIVVMEGKRDIPNEAFRVVRSNIDFMIKKGETPVLGFTSFNPGSGKSFVAFNLGASFALKGKKVLLIDGDLRHGSVSTYVNSPRKGLTTYLTGNTSDWNALVVKSPEYANLSVLPIGNRPPNPAELLENGRLGELLEQAKPEYDVVLIDCPPINIVVDTQIINQYFTRTVFVVRAGLLERKALGDLQKIVEEKKLNNVAVLLNGTKTEFSTYHTYGNYEAIDKV